MVTKAKNGKLISPYGGTLVNLIVTGEERQEVLERSRQPALRANLRPLPVRPGAAGDRRIFPAGSLHGQERITSAS